MARGMSTQAGVGGSAAARLGRRRPRACNGMADEGQLLSRTMDTSDDASEGERDGHGSAGESDGAILARAATDPTAFGTLYERHIDAVLSFLYARTASAEVAADLASETFLAAFLG